jgi:hypothetical protein
MKPGFSGAVSVALRPSLAGMQLRHSGCRRRPWLPPGDIPGALPRLLVVDDAGEAAAQFDGGRQFAVLLIDGADRGGIGFGDNEHGGEDGGGRCAGQAPGLIGQRRTGASAGGWLRPEISY